LPYIPIYSSPLNENTNLFLKLKIMEFSTELSLEILERTPDVLGTLLSGLPDEWILSNEGGETWSAYDIVGHLIHGELTDWIPRMKIILQGNGNKTFAPFDRFAQFAGSQGKTMERLLEEFAELRRSNLLVLKSANIDAGALLQTGTHPALGLVTLRQLLATWVVHDLNHLAQISRVMAKQYAGEVGPWKAYLGVLHQ
jgi:DinB superfamily